VLVYFELQLTHVVTTYIIWDTFEMHKIAANWSPSFDASDDLHRFEAVKFKQVCFSHLTGRTDCPELIFTTNSVVTQQALH